MASSFFLCPICSDRRSLSEDSAAGPCRACSTVYRTEGLDPVFHLLGRVWTPDETDADAYLSRVVDALRAEGRVAQPIEKQGYELKGGQSIRLMATQREGGELTLVTIATGPWSEELALMILNVLIPISNQMELKGLAPTFSFLAALPLPDPIRTIFESTSRGRFERLAMGQTEIWDVNEPVDPEATDALTGMGERLVDACFQIPLTGTMADVAPLNDLVLRRLRFPLGPEDPLPPGAYIPGSSLLLIGLLVGRAILSSSHSPACWASRSGSHFQLTLSTFIRSAGNRGSANIIDKVFKLFENGAEDSVDFMARHVVDESKP